MNPVLASPTPNPANAKMFAEATNLFAELTCQLTHSQFVKRVVSFETPYKLHPPRSPDVKRRAAGMCLAPLSSIHYLGAELTGIFSPCCSHIKSTVIRY